MTQRFMFKSAAQFDSRSAGEDLFIFRPVSFLAALYDSVTEDSPLSSSHGSRSRNVGALIGSLAVFDANIQHWNRSHETGRREVEKGARSLVT